MIAFLLAMTLATQTPAQTPAQAPAQSPVEAPPSQDAEQAQMQAALDGITQIYTTLGSCERHFTPEQVRGVRRAFEPEPGQAPSSLQTYLAEAYEGGKADTSLSAPVCQEMMRALAEAKAGRTRD